ncbi:hypothetical protein D3C72_1507400 [compost metagenome]
MRRSERRRSGPIIGRPQSCARDCGSPWARIQPGAAYSPTRKAPVRRATTFASLGRCSLTAMSASCRGKASSRSCTLNSSRTPGMAWRTPRSIAGSTSTPSSSLLVTRTTPSAASAPVPARRLKARAATSMASTWSLSSRAASVGCRPAGVRRNRLTPTLASSFSMRRRAVAWAMFSSRAAPDRLPLRRTARKTRWLSHSRESMLIQNLLTDGSFWRFPAAGIQGILWRPLQGTHP